MFIKQLSLFVENKSGRLAEITSIIAAAGIDIRALSIADTTNFGILRIIVDKPDQAEKILRDAGLTVSLTNVIAIGIPDVPGGFAGAMTAVRRCGSRALIVGLAVGAVFFLLLLTVGVLLFESMSLEAGGLGLLCGGLCGGAAAGLMGSKPKKKRRKK